MFLSLSIALAAQSPALRQPVTPTETEAVVGTVYTAPLGQVDDSVPLPIPAVWQPGDAGDVLIAPASGDPFFLGFAAGAHYPTAGELVDPDLYAQAQSHYGDGRPTQTTYAFVMFQKRITPERLAALEDLGCRVLGFHPHCSVKVALAPAAIDVVAGQDFVRWVGLPRAWQKVHPGLTDALAGAPDGRALEVYVNVFDSDLCEASTSRPAGTLAFGGPDGVYTVDVQGVGPQVTQSNGWQQRQLEALGLEVYEYVDAIRAFRARMLPAALEGVVALDFVQFVEYQPEPTLGHDESMPMIQADYTRQSYDGASGGVAGQADSGIDYSHSGISGYYWWASNLGGTAEATTDDPCEHGTHVGGTIHGNGNVEDSYEGAANGLGNLATTRYFNTKIFAGGGCSYGGSSMATVLASTSASVTDGSGNITPRPHAVNHSWGAPSVAGGSFGSEADCRTIDSYVYAYDQLQVIIAHNWGPGAGTVSVHGSAKNAFTIGGVRDYASGAEDPGEMYSSSGRGPTGDDRWKPNVVAPATSIRSAWAGTGTGYVNKSGTSMAAPHVTGLAAQLTDHYSFLRHNPTTLGAVLMASAMTKDDVLLTAPSIDTNNHLNNYGAGRVDAYKAHYGAGGYYMWGWDQGTGAGTYVDFTVSTGATRVVVCMYYHEVACSSGASSALVNDHDLWIDSPSGGINTTTNSGEYSAQQSSRDNTEIRIVNSPVVGTWRAKLHPVSSTNTVHVGMAVFVHYEDTTPNGSLSVTANDYYVTPNQNVVITASAYNPEYIASAVYLDSSSVGDSLQASSTTLEDGAVSNLMTNQQAGRDVLLGSIRGNDSRTAVWTTRWASEGIKTWSVNARSDNWVDKTDAVTIYVDGTPPALPTNLGSSTHTANVWSNDPTITWTWTASTDNVSGVDGYGVFVSQGTGAPSTVKDIEQVTSFNHAFAPGDSGDWYFNIKPVDNGGNWNASHATAGPYRIDLVQPDYVTGLTSSTNAIGSYSCNPNVTVNWNPTPDGGGSGLAGYYYNWSHVASESPGQGNPPLGVVTSFASALPPSTQPWYFHITPFDNAGNSQNFFNFGPIYITNPVPTIYCTGKTNSQGCVPAIGSSGVPSASGGTFTVTCTNTLNNKNGLLFFGAVPTSVPFQGGIKCVASPTQRGPNLSSGGSPGGNDCSGTYSQAINAAFMSAYNIDIGDTLYAQWWMRDPASASTTGLSNAIQFTVCQ